jgi:SAM-dependent methyltransferase
MAGAAVKENVYSGAVSNGHYSLYEGGLSGKHDNVRTYWEDQLRGIHIRPFLQALVKRKTRAGQRLRIVDLGAGAGEGLRLLTSINEADIDWHLNQAKVLPMDMIDVYIGSDLCEEMVEQGNANFTNYGNVEFRQGDFSRGFPLEDEAPFDLYYCSYGSYSHIDEGALERLLSEIIAHVSDRAIVVGEWLGRHSIEWPCYWGVSDNEMLDYSMSWMYGKGASNEEPEHFPMRYWLGHEVSHLIGHVARRTGAAVRILDLYDVSLFVGRHTNTGEYNEWVHPVRSVVNQLHEENVRTDLDHLKASVKPVAGFDEINDYYEALQFAWNGLVEYTQMRLEKRMPPVRLKNWRRYPAAVQLSMMTLDRIIDASYWLQMGDPRANIIEPQLGYALRNLERDFQQGLGRGHGLVGIFEVRKK